MAASRCNYLILHKGQSQAYSAASKETALLTPLPTGATLDDRRIFFITFQPDEEKLVLHKLPDTEVQGAVIKVNKTAVTS